MAQAAALLTGQARVRRDAASQRGAQKLVDRVDPVETGRVERDDRRERLVRLDAAKADEVERAAADRLEKVRAVLIVNDGVEQPAREVQIVRQGRRDGRQEDDAGIGLRRPEHRRLAGRTARWYGETAGPSA